MLEDESHDAIERAARNSYAQLLSFVAARAGGDVAGAEDALSEAFLAALHQWPREGVPVKPEAWLLATARRRLLDAQRRGATRRRLMNDLPQAFAAAQAVVDAGGEFPDERLGLLFVCAHPAIDPAARTPLMLQTVLGIDAERIASAFLTSPVSMSQRLVRAKTKIRAAGIPLAVPPREEWPERVGFVLDAIYAAYDSGWEDPSVALPGAGGLAAEALWLARVMAQLLPDEPEALGLLALLLHCQARVAARLDAGGRYVPLPEQDTALWDHALIAQAEAALATAARHRRLGRFQLEAAIQSVHAQRARTGETQWEAVALLYEALIQQTPALGAQIGRAIALARTRGPAAGLAALDALPQELLANHQPYWATRAQLLSELQHPAEAHAAYARAIALCEDPAVRAFLNLRAGQA